MRGIIIRSGIDIIRQIVNENITGNQFIKVSFDKYHGKDGKLYDLTKALPEFNVKFSAINGILSDNLAKVINNVACVNYTISDNDTITVESGDEIFNIKVIVAKETSIILINVDDIVVGENATIDVFVNKNATGSVIMIKMGIMILLLIQ